MSMERQGVDQGQASEAAPAEPIVSSPPDPKDLVSEPETEHIGQTSVAHATLTEDRPRAESDSADTARAQRGIRQAIADARRAAKVQAGPIVPLASVDLNAPLPEFSTSDDIEDEPDLLPDIEGYSLLQVLGVGGQATVFEAIQESTGKRCAIKLLRGSSPSSRQRERFERETAILASLQHPHIVGILDRGRTNEGQSFFVMPCVVGCALDEYVSGQVAGGGFSMRQLVALFQEIASAVGEAHRLGIIHRDLKPSNIRVDNCGEPYVLDFGLARLNGHGVGGPNDFRSVTSDGQIVGSLPWASPEQTNSARRVDARSDVYAIGVLLYQSLTGVMPYETVGQIKTVVDNIVFKRPIRPSSMKEVGLGPISDELDAIVMACLEKSPSRRYANASLLSQALSRVALSNMERRRPLGVTRTWRQLRRQFSRVGVVASVLLIAAAAWRLSRSTAPRPSASPLLTELPSRINLIGQKFHLIPSGQFLMGPALNEGGRKQSDRQHPESVDRPFFMAVTETTVGQYSRVVRNVIVNDRELANLPVSNVSMPDATEFCRRLTALDDGWVYRLPTETEWEYACRAGSKGEFNVQGPADVSTWYAANSGKRIHPVAAKLPNAWGLFDMHGNVREWCYNAVGGGQTTLIEFAGKTSGLGSTRGGCFSDSEDLCHAATRQFYFGDLTNDATGFRVVCTPSEK